MPINIAFYPQILDLVIGYVYDDRDVETLGSLRDTGKHVSERVAHILNSHSVCEFTDEKGEERMHRHAWNSGHTRLLDVVNFRESARETKIPSEDAAEDLAFLQKVIKEARPDVLRFTSELHHQLHFTKVNASALKAAIYNIDIIDSAFAEEMDIPDEDPILAYLSADVPMSILHFRYDARVMGDMAISFAAPKSDNAQELCVLVKPYELEPSRKSPWNSRFMEGLATCVLEYLSMHPNATATMVGMEDWSPWCGSSYNEVEEEWRHVLLGDFSSVAEQVKYAWDWMLNTHFGHEYPDLDNMLPRVRYETEPQFRKRVGEEIMRIALQPPAGALPPDDGSECGAAEGS